MTRQSNASTNKNIFYYTYMLLNICRFLPTKNNRRMRQIDRDICKLLRGIIQKREKAIKNGETNSDDLGNGRSRRPRAGDSSGSGSLAAATHRRVFLPRRRPSELPEARATCEEGGGRALSSSFSGSGRARPSGPPWWFAGGSCPPRRGWPGGHRSSLPAVPAAGFPAQIHRPAPKGMSSK